MSTCLFCLSDSKHVVRKRCSQNHCIFDCHSTCWNDYARHNNPLVSCPICRNIVLPRLTRTCIKNIYEHGVVLFLQQTLERNGSLDKEFVWTLLDHGKFLDDIKLKTRIYTFLLETHQKSLYKYLKKRLPNMDWIICF